MINTWVAQFKTLRGNEDRNMSTIKYMLATVTALILLALIGTVEAKSFATRSCPGPSGDPDKRMLHETILKNAILAELAYGGEGEANLNLQQACPMGTSSAEDGISIQIKRVPDFIVKQAMGIFGNDRDLQIRMDEEGRIRCGGQDREDRIAAAYEFAEINGRLSLLIRVAIVGVAEFSDMEELGVLLLTDDDDNEIIGISGTDPGRFDQWSASVSELIGSSCAFDFSVEVAKGFFNYENLVEGRHVQTELEYITFGVVGHSLGGAVVQNLMVKADFDQALTDLEMALERDGLDFRAYSFNSIGVKGESPPENRVGNLTSVRVAGDILERIEADLEGEYSRRQLGRIFRYSTDSQWWINLEPIEFHRIESVQRAICDCLDGSSQTFQFEFRP